MSIIKYVSIIFNLSKYSNLNIKILNVQILALGSVLKPTILKLFLRYKE